MALRKGRKKQWDSSNLNPAEAAERLFKDHQVRTKLFRDKVREEDFRLVNEAHPCVNHRTASDSTLQSAREASIRLHKDAIRRNQELQWKLEHQNALDNQDKQNKGAANS